MSLGFVWRAGLALVVGLGFGLLALRFISGADGSTPRAPSNSFTPRLSLARQASTWRWSVYQGLSKYLVTKEHFAAEQITDVLDNSNGCGA